jgi:hypothetical protein
MSRWLEVDPTPEDLDAAAFRITRHSDTGADTDRFMMVMYCLIGDYVDGEIMWRAVQSCESLREFEMQHDWLREEALKAALHLRLRLLDDYLKLKLEI